MPLNAPGGRARTEVRGHEGAVAVPAHRDLGRVGDAPAGERVRCLALQPAWIRWALCITRAARSEAPWGVQVVGAAT